VNSVYHYQANHNLHFPWVFNFSIKKSKVIRKRLGYAVSIAISLALFVLLTFFPFENLFVTFSSPKDSYEYYSFRKSNIQLVLEGNNCDFVVDCRDTDDTYLIIPKNADGWKVGIGANTKRISHQIFDGIVIYLYQYGNSNDYFLTIFDTNGGKINLSDDCNTQFYSLEKNNGLLDKTFITYYAHVPNLDPQYYIIANGEKIVVDQDR